MTTITARNPFTGEHDYSFEQVSAEEVKATCERLRANQPAWAAKSLEERIAILKEFAAVCEKNADVISKALIQDEGRVMIAQYEVSAISSELDRMIGDARKMLVEPEPRETLGPGVLGSGQWVPYQLVGNISPWNFPLILSLVDTLPALLTGSAVVIKPSEVTPRWVDPFEAAIQEVPELAKVFGFVRGAGETGAELVNHVDIVAFTGSVRTGRLVGESAARNFIPCFLELGGKDPAIVLKSSNLDVATSAVLRASVSATGQACQSLERVYVDEAIYDDFVTMIVEKAGQVALNTSDIAQGHVGPLIFEKQAETIKDHLDDAIAKGAKVEAGGEIIHKGGIWVEPTILTNVDHTMKVVTDETFGPVIPIMKFSSVDEAIEKANDTVYGLSASVFAGSTEEAMEVAARVNGGTVSINDGSITAFVHDVESETFGLSGMGGTRFGSQGILRFLRRKAFLNNTFGPMDINGEPVPLNG